MWEEEVKRGERWRRKKAVQWVYRETSSLTEFFFCIYRLSEHCEANRGHQSTQRPSPCCSVSSHLTRGLTSLWKLTARQIKREVKNQFFPLLHIPSLFFPYLLHLENHHLAAHSGSSWSQFRYCLTFLSLLSFFSLSAPLDSSCIFFHFHLGSFTSLHVFFLLLAFLLKFFLDDCVGKDVKSFIASCFSPSTLFFQCPFLF